MKTFIKLAWRNLFRNKRRTLIAGSAIGIGLASLIFVDALIVGMKENMVRSATASFLGEGQIHRDGFREVHEVEATINNLDEVVYSLKEESIVENFTLRTISFAIITSPANVSSISLIGVKPITEKQLSEVDDVIIEGTYFRDETARDVVIGNKLAEILEVGIGDRIVITVARAHSKDLSQEMFRVSGIYSFGIREMDQALAFIRREKAQEMLGLGGDVHEIAIKFTDIGIGRDTALPFWEKYSRHENEAVGWTKILPEMEAAFELSQFSILITGLILFGVIALGIINTLFMSIHERMFEFGVLRAVGTRSGKMMLLILFEAAGLAVLSISLGMLLGFGITSLSAKTGIDYRGIEMGGVAIRDLLYPVMNLKQFIVYPLAVFLFISITAVYPALHVTRLAPAESIRKSI